MKTIEIELRYEILNPQGIDLLEKSCTFQSEKRVIDWYLDTPSVDLLKKGIYIRIRDSRKIDIKFNRACLLNPDLELQDSCEEHSFSLPLQSESLEHCNTVLSSLELEPFPSTDINEFMERNNLIYHRTVDKVRKSYTAKGFTLVIDQVKDLGLFLEIEVMALPGEAVEQIAKRMREYIFSLSSLNLKPLKTGYDSLTLRKHNFEEYIQGRFILEEDKLIMQERKAQASYKNQSH